MITVRFPVDKASLENLAILTVTPDLLAQAWDDLHRLVGQYLSPGQGYASRRAVFKARFPGDYDHLARFGEWDMTDKPVPGDVG